MNLTDVYKTFDPTSAQYTLFSQPMELKINHILGNKPSLSKYKKIEIIPCILYYHNALKLELNNKTSSKKHANNWKLNNTLHNHQWLMME
jgi:hypothetical protein